MVASIKSVVLIVLGIILGVLTVRLLKNKNIKKAFNILIYILYIFIIIISAQKIIYRDNRILNCYLFKVSSGSMENTLKVNDYILVKEQDTYKEGDIITYQMDNRTITHRIVKVDGDVIITKGDANFNIDKSIMKKDVIGKTILHGEILNIFVNYISYMIIAYATSYLVASIFIKKEKQKN